MLNSLKHWTLAAVFLAALVIVLGAYTRLTDAGLGCPDWPGCYGRLIAPASSKAWTEMIHRYVAGSLGILILALALKTIWARSNWQLALVILALVIFQAALGMWTVTLGLYPVVVLGHLLGGFAILALLWLLWLLQAQHLRHRTGTETGPYIVAYIGLVILIIQIALGGWTSANYAALVCADFPSCQGSYWPAMDWRRAFDFTAVGIFDSPGVPLENTARVTIQMCHRLGALITAMVLSLLAYFLIRNTQTTLQRLGITLLCLLAVQITLGITNVVARLPIAISLMHNAIAALLLILMVTILYELHEKNRSNQ
jgi:cytochrome c oxidase assembly protein subunit 15